MGSHKPIALRTEKDLTSKQKKFLSLLVKNWGMISQTEAALKAGYGNNERSASVMASKMLDQSKNPHIARVLENMLAKEAEKYEKDKLRRYKTFERLRDGAEDKGQFTASINAEYRSGQLAGLFVDKKEIQHTTLEGMSREQLEERLKDLENKIGANTIIVEGEVKN
tara:strand:+ start:1332 stop:1832 length:501 start_codon:yes stop_codon:yes gene_type:complete